MSTAIAMRNARNVYFRNVAIRGFNKGIEARNSHLLLDGVNIQRCGIGLDLMGSKAIIYRSQLYDNAVDIIVNKSTAYMIDVTVGRILRILKNGDCRISPYQLRLRHIGLEIIKTADEIEKRRRFEKWLAILKSTSYIWTVYEIVNEILRFIG